MVAAGNSNANACHYSPARVGPAITVGATTSSDARASYSNFGNCLDLFAPGSTITSAWHTGNTATNTISGTSMASPHVAGAAALYLQGNPGASPSAVSSALAGNATTGKVTGAGAGAPNRLLYTGFIGGGGGTEPPPNQSPTASFSFSCTNLTCSFDGTGSSDPDGSITAYAWNFGDGTSGSGAVVSKSYASAGTYAVTLTVTDNSGASGSTSQSVTVTAPGGGRHPAVRCHGEGPGDELREPFLERGRGHRDGVPEWLGDCERHGDLVHRQSGAGKRFGHVPGLQPGNQHLLQQRHRPVLTRGGPVPARGNRPRRRVAVSGRGFVPERCGGRRPSGDPPLPLPLKHPPLQTVLSEPSGEDGPHRCPPARLPSRAHEGPFECWWS